MEIHLKKDDFHRFQQNACWCALRNNVVFVAIFYRKTQYFTVAFNRKTHQYQEMPYLCSNKKAVTCYNYREGYTWTKLKLVDTNVIMIIFVAL